MNARTHLFFERKLPWANESEGSVNSRESGEQCERAFRRLSEASRAVLAIS